MTNDQMNKRDCFERATALLSHSHNSELSYAALELRLCLEAVLYDKLEFYAALVPGQVLQKWQPAHALKMLLQFEPHADENCQISIGKETAPGEPATSMRVLGEYKTFSLAWLEKNYNKLGSYLHLPHGRDRAFDAAKVRQDLLEIAKEVDAVLKASISESAFATRIQFKCEACGQDSLANVDGLRATGRAVCVKPSCGAAHFASEENNSWLLRLEASGFLCLICKAEVRIQNRHLGIGYSYRCSKCGSEHYIEGRQWSYGLKDGLPTKDL